MSAEAQMSPPTISTGCCPCRGQESKRVQRTSQGAKPSDEDDYASNKVKERSHRNIFSPCRPATKKVKVRFLCLVEHRRGKTSLGKSVPKHGREFVRVVLGGVRTLIRDSPSPPDLYCSIPGRVISTIKSRNMLWINFRFFCVLMRFGTRWHITR